MGLAMMKSEEKRVSKTITAQQRAYLLMGKTQAGGKLPLFDHDGQAIKPHIIRDCIQMGWAERWFANPMKPDWLVCRLTSKGREIIR